MYDSYRAFVEKYVPMNLIEWHLMKSNLRVSHYDKGDIIIHMDEICKELLFITQGLARGYLIDEKGKDYTWCLYFNDKNAQVHNLFVTDYESFLHQKPSNIEIEALEACEVISVAYTDVQNVYSYLKKGERFGRLMAEEAYSYLHQQIIDRQTKSAKERFEDFLKQTPFLLDKVPQYYIATLLGITPQHLSRLKKEYKS